MAGLRTMKALAEMREVFARYSKPRAISHCRMCYSEEEIQKFLSFHPAHMNDEDFQPILVDGCQCFGSWPEIAYYIPHLLEVCLADWYVYRDNLFFMLLRAAGDIDNPMDREDSRAIFIFLQAYLEDELDQVGGGAPASIDDAILLLGAFHGEMAETFDRLGGSSNPWVRANYCLFVAKQVLGLRKRPKMLPESEAAFDALLKPDVAIDILLTNIDDVHYLLPDDRYTVDYTFDYLVKKSTMV